MKRLEIYVCHGRTCKEALAKAPGVEKIAATFGTVVQVRCQKVCDGPVVGVEIDERLQWFERVASKKSLAAFGALLADGVVTKPLEKRRHRRRAGKLRR